MRHLATTISIAAGLCAGTAACDSGGGDEGDTSTLIREGDLYPAVRVQECDGTEVDMRTWLAAHDASYITFGAQWCVACQEEAPIINRELVDGLANRGESVGVLQILIENQPDEPPPQSLCADWRDALQARFAVLIDTRQEHLEPMFGGAVGTLPLHLVVTGDGLVRYKKLGALPADVRALVEGWLP
jgi:hypothetical protein